MRERIGWLDERRYNIELNEKKFIPYQFALECNQSACDIHVLGEIF
jgi:hypothetical protein